SAPDVTGGCGGVTTGIAAVPVPSPLRVLPDAGDCHLAQFKSLAPQELQEETLLQKDIRCHSRLFPRVWDLRQLQTRERPVALQAELALTLNVLGNVADPALGDILDQPLHTLHHIHSQLRACALAQPTAGPRPKSHRLSHWLHRLQEGSPESSLSSTGVPGCLQASVTFHLFRLLTRDLKCVTRGDVCV
uniref:Interferon lambda-3-like n=1 Tax=Castor canadensis TaxID=51338 RepID=A0A8C0WJU2_CASCN